jgi:hypothetical protein
MREERKKGRKKEKKRKERNPLLQGVNKYFILCCSLAMFFRNDNKQACT